jgi:hypothetical protein
MHPCHSLALALWGLQRVTMELVSAEPAGHVWAVLLLFVLCMGCGQVSMLVFTDPTAQQRKSILLCLPNFSPLWPQTALGYFSGRGWRPIRGPQGHVPNPTQEVWRDLIPVTLKGPL